MDQRPWQRELKRTYMRGALRWYKRGQNKHRFLRNSVRYGWITVAVAVFVALVSIAALEAKLRPTLEAAVTAQTHNEISVCLEQAISSDLAKRKVGYAEFVSVQRDGQGNITALTTDMAALNLLRAELMSVLLDTLSDLRISDIEIPMGSLIDSEFLWARGPSVRVRTIQVGSVDAEFRSEFLSAGVNQTKHRIWLEWDIPVTVILPGGKVLVPVQTQLCVAETVVVGQVPDIYLGYSEKMKTDSNK